MASTLKIIAVALILCVATGNVAAQSFDLRPQTTKDKNESKKVLMLLDNNDVAGMRKFLKDNKEAANCISRVEKSARGVKTEIPLLFDAVERVLSNDGSTSPEMCQVIIDAGCDLHPNCKGTTPIYLLMDFFATHPKSQCSTAMQVLKAFATRSDWDANERYRSKMPPLNYLIRTNYEFLGNKFNSDYIADDVLTIMLEHGASVTSYNQDGQTLLTFALETDNKNLQNYLIKNGVNFQHQDNKGEDDIYRMIADGEIELIKQVLAIDKNLININTLRNDTKDIARYPHLYELISTHCAQLATNYDEMVLFRQRFADCKQMVQQKYETLANGEISQTVTFSDIMKVEDRYPDIPHLTDPRKLSIYRQDCQRLQAIHTKALATANDPNYSLLPVDNFPNEFINLYSDSYHYDPDSLLSLAHEVQSFFAICAGLNFSPHPYKFCEDTYATIANGFSDIATLLSFGFVRMGKLPEVQFPGLNEDRQLLNNALAACRSTSSLGYQDFMRRSESTILSKQQRLHEYEQRVYAEYEDYKAELEQKVNAIRQEQEAKEKAEREHNKFMEDHVDSNLSDVGITYTTGDWEQSFIDHLVGVKTKSLKVKYSDGKEGIIYKHPDEDTYLPSGGKHFLYNERYVTLYDAIAAEYFFHYDVTRSKGKKKF